MCFEHLMSTCCESCLEQIVLRLSGALSISRSGGGEGRVCFGSVNVLPSQRCLLLRPRGGRLLPVMLSSGRLALNIWPFFSRTMKEVEQRVQISVSWRAFPLGLGNFWMRGIKMDQTCGPI